MLEDQLFCPYRGGAAAPVEGDVFPGSHKNGDCRERRHVLEILPDIFGDFFEEGRVCALTVVDFPTDPVVNVCPKRSNEGPSVGQREGFWCKLADQHIKGDNTIVVYLERLRGRFDLSLWKA